MAQSSSDKSLAEARIYEITDRITHMVHFQSDPKGIDFIKVMVCPPRVGEYVVLTTEGEDDKSTICFEVARVEYWVTIPKDENDYDSTEMYIFCTIVPVEKD